MYMHTDVPTNLTATLVSSTAIFLTWQAASSVLGNFLIYYQQQFCSSCQLHTLKVNTTGSGSQWISGLSPYTRYRVYMTFIDYYDISESEPSGTLIVTTQLGISDVLVSFFSLVYNLVLSFAAPPSAPRGLRHSSVSSTSITLSWSLPTIYYGANYTQSLTCRDTSNEAESHRIMEEFSDQRRSQTITFLQPGARYNCCIWAENSAGYSSYTCINVTTNETGICTQTFNLLLHVNLA